MIQNVLILDDNGTLSLFYKTLLEKTYQLTISEAKNGKQGLNKLENEIPDLILLDIDMPQMNGYQFLEKIRKNANYKNIPVIMLSSQGDRDTVEKFLGLGISGYMLKTFNKIEFLNSFESIFKKLK